MISSRSVRSTVTRAAGAGVLAGAMLVAASPVQTAVATASPAVVAPGVAADLPMPTGGGWGHLNGHGHGGWGHGKLGKGKLGHGWVNGGRINGFIHSGGRGGW